MKETFFVETFLIQSSSLVKVSSIIGEMSSLPPLTDGNSHFLQAGAGWLILNKTFKTPKTSVISF